MLKMKIRRKTYTGKTLADMVRLWNETRDRLDFGYSKQAGADIVRDGEVIARVSYNGRLWDVTGAEICAF